MTPERVALSISQRFSGDEAMPVIHKRTWRYAICNELFEGWDLEKVARFASGLGYEGLELAPYTLAPTISDISQSERRHLRQAVSRGGCEIVALHWLLARTEGLYLNDAEPEVRERTVRYLLDEVDLCADLGGSVLVFGSPQQRNPRPGVTIEDAWAWTKEAMWRCGERAAQQGVVFCIEPLAPPECSFITSVDEAARLVQQVNHPAFRMIVDVKAMAQDPRPVSEQIRTVAPLVHHVHVNDPNMLGPGMGSVDFRPILRTLAEIGYSRWVSVEAFDASYGIEGIAQESIANLLAAEIVEEQG